MGSLFSSCCGQDDNIYESEQNDKTNLLENTVGETSRSSSQNISHKHPIDGIGDQQDKLNKILQKTANSYIDVPALSSPVDQPTDKTKDYETKIQTNMAKKLYTQKSHLLEDNSQLERTLSEDPLEDNDKKMVKDAGLAVLAALQSMQIQNSENLVIPFNSPKANN